MVTFFTTEWSVYSKTVSREPHPSVLSLTFVLSFTRDHNRVRPRLTVKRLGVNGSSHRDPCNESVEVGVKGREMYFKYSGTRASSLLDTPHLLPPYQGRVSSVSFLLRQKRRGLRDCDTDTYARGRPQPLSNPAPFFLPKFFLVCSPPSLWPFSSPRCPSFQPPGTVTTLLRSGHGSGV